MEILSQIFYFIIIIGVLVFVHELGHFLAAKMFKMRVERFSIGFPPRAFGKKWGETDYCVSWLPIGGYVKIAGMVDESMDTEHLEKEPEPWEFRAKPVWQRMVVIVAGVVMNIILAVGIFWGLNLTTGKEYHEITTVGFVYPNTAASAAGLEHGDKILAVNGEAVNDWENLITSIYREGLSEDVKLKVERGGGTTTVTVPKDKMPNLNEEQFGIIPMGMFAKVGNVQSDSPADRVGLQQGDKFVAINDTTVWSASDVTRIVQQHPDHPIKVTWLRDGKEMASMITPEADGDNGKIGIVVETDVPGPIRTVKYGFFEAFGVGVSDLNKTLVLYAESFYNMFTGKSDITKNIGGPVKIAEMAAQSAELGMSKFLMLMAILSISLAIINILPFPALDGGHFMFLVYEGIFRKEIPNKIKIALQQAGMVILLGFMIWVIYNDIIN